MDQDSSYRLTAYDKEQDLLSSPSRSGRSKSFDSAAARANQTNKPKSYPRSSGTFLELPKWKMLVRKAANSSTYSSGPTYERDCYHCLLKLEQDRIAPSISPRQSGASLSSESSLIDDSDTDSTCRTPVHSESLEDDVLDSSDGSNTLPTVTLSPAPMLSITSIDEEDIGLTVISLEVPVLPKSGRSASVDSSYLQVPQRTDIGIGEPPPVKNQRSKSVDVALPVGPDGPYIVVPIEKPAPLITQ